jgi:hypothetical protein
MSIAEILIWESTNLLLLIPVVLGLVIAIRWWKGQPVFTDRDWRFLFGHAKWMQLNRQPATRNIHGSRLISASKKKAKEISLSLKLFVFFWD